MKIKKAMLSLGLVLAAAGVATASAWVINVATASTQGAVDQGIILDWGEGSTLGDTSPPSPTGAPSSRRSPSRNRRPPRA